MKMFWLILSAVDAGFGFEGFATGHYGWGIWMSSLAALGLILASNSKEKINDEA